MHLKWEINSKNAHRLGNFFPKLRYFLPIYKKTGETSHSLSLSLSSFGPKLIYFLKRGWYSINFFFITMAKFSKNSLSNLQNPNFTWLVAAMLVELIMTETDIKFGHTKTTLHARCVSKSHHIITFSHLSSTNFNNNFKEKVKSALVLIIRSFASFVFFHHLYV